ncbi:MAG: sensor histidine kinase [Catenulispora sp.]|nr:sensor histidine kinase [Catenulispora sp.]
MLHTRTAVRDRLRVRLPDRALGRSLPIAEPEGPVTWPLWRRRLVETPHVPALAVALLAIAASGEALIRTMSRLGADAGGSGRAATALFLALCATVPLGFLGSLGAATAITAAAVLAAATTGALPGAAAAAAVLAMYRLGWAMPPVPAPADPLTSRRLSGLVPLALAVPYLIIALATAKGSDSQVLGVLLSAAAPAAAFAGSAARARTQARIHHAAREAVARSLVEHTARGERARIARELHDVVAHHISMIAVQAETARLATPGMPAQGAERLLAIGDTARAGLTEMRRLLGVLKEDVGPPDQPADRHPLPGLHQLLTLVDDARRTSATATRLIVSGTPAPLDPGVELAAYRITQEALTNARRHAHGAPVDVELRFSPDTLRLRIMDSGTGIDSSPASAATATPGHGLSGMRERAASVGGRLEAGRSPSGGFLVEAWLPADPAQHPAAVAAVVTNQTTDPPLAPLPATPGAISTHVAALPTDGSRL